MDQNAVVIRAVEYQPREYVLETVLGKCKLKLWHRVWTNGLW